MNKFLQKFIPPRKTFLGLEIGESEIKVIEVKKTKNDYQVVKLGKVETPPGAIDDGKIINPEAVADALKGLLASQSFQTKEVFISVNGSNVITRQLPMPVMAEKDIYSALKYEAERYIPIPLEDLIIDYIIIGQEEGEEGQQYNLLLVAVPQQVIYQLYDLLVGIGLAPIAVEIVPTALWRIYSLQQKYKASKTKGNSVLIDIGTKASNLMVFNNGRLNYTRSIPIGGEKVTETVAQTFMLNLEDAESFKKSEGLIIVENEENELLDSNALQLDLAIRSGVAEILHEVQRSIDYFKLKSRKNNSADSEAIIDEICILGGTSRLIGLPELFEAELGIPVRRINRDFFATSGFLSIKEEVLNLLDESYSVALGLALREVAG